MDYEKSKKSINNVCGVCHINNKYGVCYFLLFYLFRYFQ